MPLAFCAFAVMTEAPAEVVIHASANTSQSPGWRVIEVTGDQLPVVSAIAAPLATVAATYSPTLPAAALLLVAVPTMPLVPVKPRLPERVPPAVGRYGPPVT